MSPLLNFGNWIGVENIAVYYRINRIYYKLFVGRSTSSLDYISGFVVCNKNIP